jgi:hypothetical protein
MGLVRPLIFQQARIFRLPSHSYRIEIKCNLSPRRDRLRRLRVTVPVRCEVTAGEGEGDVC